MKILIVGITGFAGFHLYNKLAEENDEIWGIARTISYSPHFKKAKIIECDITDESSVDEVLEKCKPDYIYHLAAFVYIGRTQPNTEMLFNTNVIGTLNLLRSVQKIVPNSKILITGSAEEYGAVGQEKLPIKEDYRLNPQNLYGLSKKFQEEVGTYYHKLHNLDIVFTRSFHYFGPYQPLNFVFADFASQIVDIEDSDKDYITVGNLKAQRDFTDIRDVVAAYKLIMEKGKAGEVYNVCSGSAISIEEILKKFLGYAKKNIEIKVEKNKLRPVDVPIFIGDNQKLKSIGWKNEFSLDNSIKDVLEYWREKKQEQEDEENIGR